MNIFTSAQIKRGRQTDTDSLEKVFELHIKSGIKSVNYTRENYPRRFKDIDGAPPVIYYKGDISLLDSRRTVSVVGSRHCSAEGERACRMIAGRLAQKAVVISGLARGIDIAAHRACAENGGRTVAVLGVGVSEYYPAVHRAFQDMLRNSHLVISEYPAGQRRYASNFVQRNRLIAAAGDRLCVIQAGEHSGSLITAGKALEYGKQVFAVPGSIFSPYYSGSNRLIADGLATALLSAAQLEEYLGLSCESEDGKTAENKPELPAQYRDILDVMDKDMTSRQIVRACGISPAQVKAALTDMELMGIITRGADGKYLRNQ